jgi:hypothetical protein
MSPGVGWDHKRGNHFTYYDYMIKICYKILLRTIRPEKFRFTWKLPNAFKNDFFLIIVPGGKMESID